MLAHPHVVAARVTAAPGDAVAPARSSVERVGHVLLSAPDPGSLEVALDDVRSTLRVATRLGAP
ncbi:hypothetical protein NEH16_28070 [Streptomyces drozdowiczii]|uniref:L-amino acid ligase C-terminal domain-containing protein n=1 Tax=Streptomyces drozdowiczii TaxID=202862 RepID=A0ABY6PZF8_9ACTN|nr:hypothetical protein [Streptomyces drozdowiczii]UZK57430.1 hypothetical protein NEH16_28070 [Streptomyces drozdowiczii]